MHTTLLVISLVVLLGLSAFLWALFLRVGLQWAKVEGVSTRRIALTTTLVFVLRLILSLLVLAFSPEDSSLAVQVAVLGIIAEVLIQYGTIMFVFRIGFSRSVKSWLPTLISVVIMIGLIMIAFRPMLFEAFKLPTNGMAPTLVGIHWRGQCPVCGMPTYGSAHAIRDGRPYPGSLVICERFHETEAGESGDPSPICGGDRLFVAKYLQPQRWDLIVFRYPEDPSIFYVKRLVGLPGEVITIQDGRVWADGKVLTPPESLSGIQYASGIDDFTEVWGSLERPAKLASGEYFVLGDFSRSSKDSRFWEQGAPGHPPYAVPESYLHGVVTLTYWPPSRWRAFR